MKPPQQSWIHPNIEIKVSELGGKGMFATSPIGLGEKVLVWGGVYVNKQEAQGAVQEGKLVLQWDDDLFSVEDRGEDDAYFINHSCDPNVWMSDAFTLVARRDISTGEELTADYALWEAREDYVSSWDCHCGAKNCRGKVTGTDWMLQELQISYSGHFSPLLNKRIAAIKK
jgi:SET domain-containing protein